MYSQSSLDFALWFLRVSDSDFASAYRRARLELSVAKLDDRVQALDARMCALNAQRTLDGSLPQTVLMRLEEQKSRMREVVSRGAA